MMRHLLPTAVLAAVLVSFPARADVRTEARRHFRAGMQLIAAESYQAGIAELERAYEILPHPVVRYNIARAWADLGDAGKAVESYEAYLATDPDDRAQVEAVVALLRERLTPEVGESVADGEDVELGTASAEDLRALEESAEVLATLAEVSASEQLRDRAERLRRLAGGLRGEEVEADSDPTVPEAALPATSASAPAPEPRTGPATEAPAVDDVYAERVVSASRFSQSPLDAPNSTTIVTAQDIRLSGVTNLAELLRRAGGVEVMTLTPGDSEVSIRGLNQRLSNKVLVLIDGRSVYLDFLGTTLWQALPLAVEDIERIEVIRGPASALYGADAFAGIVNIVMREPGEGSSHLAVRGGDGRFVDGSITANGRTEAVSWRLAAGYVQSAQYSLPVDPARVDLALYPDDPEMGLRQARLSADLRARLAEGWRVRGGTALSSGALSFQGISRLRDLHARDSLFAQSHLGLTTPFGLEVRTYWNVYRTDVGGFGDARGTIPITIDDLDSHAVDVEVVYSRRLRLGFDHDLALGAGYRFKSIAMDWLDGDHEEHHLSAYLEDAMRVHRAVRVLVSARVDRHPLLDAVQFSPRGSVVVRPTDGSALRATIGTAFRSPTFVESYLDFENQTPVRGVTALGLGNRELEPEGMVSAEVGYALDAGVIAAEANAYYNLVRKQIVLSRIQPYRLQDYPGYREDVAAYPLGQLQFENEAGTFRQLGGDVGVRVFPVTGLDVYVNYALHDTAPTDPEIDLGGREADRRTSTHKINGGVQYRSRFGLDVSLDVHWVDDQLWVEQVTDQVTGVRFEAFELPGYLLLNARVGYRLLDDRLELALLGTNLVDDGHREHPFGQRIGRRVMVSATARF